MDQRLQQIRLVTERYSELHGLRLMFAGGMLATVCGIMLIVQSQPGQKLVLRTIIATLVAMMPVQWLLARYYKVKFGRTVRRRPRASGLWVLATMGIALGLTGNAFGPAQVAATFALGSAGALWVAVRDWPLRSYHVLGCAAAAFGASIQFMALEAGSLPHAQAVSCLVLGLAYLPVGFLDHRLLTTVLQPRAVAPETADERRQA